MIDKSQSYIYIIKNKIFKPIVKIKPSYLVKHIVFTRVIFVLNILCIYLFYVVINNIYSNFHNVEQTSFNYTFKIYANIDSTYSPSLFGKTIVLDAGHDDSSNIFGDYIEGVTMLKLAQKIAPLLENEGATVYMTRQNGEYMANEARAAVINIASLETLRIYKTNAGYSENDSIFKQIDEYTDIMRLIIDDPVENGAKYLNSPYDEKNEISQTMVGLFELQDDEMLRQNFIAISLHSNALLIDRYDMVSGAEIYYMDNDMGGNFTYFDEYDSTEYEIKFANIMLDEISNTGMGDNGIYTQNFMVVRETNAPCVLIENGYHTNDNDRALLSNDYYLDKLATAYLVGIIQYFSEMS